MVGFLREKLQQDREFRSEGLQEENNERESRERWHNQLIIQNRQMQTQQSHAIQALQQGQTQVLALLLQRQQSSVFVVNCVRLFSEILFKVQSCKLKSTDKSSLACFKKILKISHPTIYKFAVIYP